MSYIPTIALVWFGRGYSRTLFMPVRVALTLFQGGVELPVGDELEDANVEKVKSLSELTSRFMASIEADNDLYDILFDDISNMPMCLEEYCEYEDNEICIGDVPPGMAIVQWHTRAASP